MKEPNFYLFSDGSCDAGKHDMGAWASFVIGKESRKLLYGMAQPTTISRCELLPLIEGLRYIRKLVKGRTGGIAIRAFSDSEYTVKTLAGGYPPGKNMDLWAGMDYVSQGFTIDWVYRERNSHYYMELCDSVCSILRKRSIEVIKDMLGAEPAHIADIVPVKSLPSNEEDTLLKGLENANTTHS